MLKRTSVLLDRENRNNINYNWQVLERYMGKINDIVAGDIEGIEEIETAIELMEIKQKELEYRIKNAENTIQLLEYDKLAKEVERMLNIIDDVVKAGDYAKEQADITKEIHDITVEIGNKTTEQGELAYEQYLLTKGITEDYEEYINVLDNLIVKTIEIKNEAKVNSDKALQSSKIAMGRVSKIDDIIKNVDGWEFRGDYSESKTYVENNIVYFNGSSYILKNGKWLLLAQRGLDGDGKEKIKSVNNIYPDLDGNIDLGTIVSEYKFNKHKNTIGSANELGHFKQGHGLRVTEDGVLSIDFATSSNVNEGSSYKTVSPKVLINVLKNYVSKEELSENNDTVLNEVIDMFEKYDSDIKLYIEDKLTNLNIDLEDYYTKEEVDNLLKEGYLEYDEKLIELEGKIPNTDVFETKEDAEIKLKESKDYTDSRLKDLDIPLVDNLETKEDAEIKLKESKDYTDSKIEKQHIENLNQFTTQSTHTKDLNNLRTDLNNKIDDIDIPDTSIYETKEDSLEKYKDNKQYTDFKFNSIEPQDLSHLETKEAANTKYNLLNTKIDDKFDSIEIPDVSDFATKEELKIKSNEDRYYTDKQIKELDIPDVTNLETKIDAEKKLKLANDYTDSKIDGLEQQDLSDYETIVNSDYKHNKALEYVDEQISTINLDKYDNHLENNNNPHGVTKQQVGLGNVRNFDVADEDIAKEGISASHYMTPQTTKIMISKFGGGGGEGEIEGDLQEILDMLDSRIDSMFWQFDMHINDSSWLNEYAHNNNLSISQIYDLNLASDFNSNDKKQNDVTTVSYVDGLESSFRNKFVQTWKFDNLSKKVDKNSNDKLDTSYIYDKDTVNIGIRSDNIVLGRGVNTTGAESLIFNPKGKTSSADYTFNIGATRSIIFSNNLGWNSGNGSILDSFVYDTSKKVNNTLEISKSIFMKSNIKQSGKVSNSVIVNSDLIKGDKNTSIGGNINGDNNIVLNSKVEGNDNIVLNSNTTGNNNICLDSDVIGNNIISLGNSSSLKKFDNSIYIGDNSYNNFVVGNLLKIDSKEDSSGNIGKLNFKYEDWGKLNLTYDNIQNSVTSFGHKIYSEYTGFGYNLRGEVSFGQANTSNVSFGYMLDDVPVAIGTNNFGASDLQFTVGNGSTSSSGSNALQIFRNGDMMIVGSYRTAGGDYAELFEWDESVDYKNNDYIGRAVTFNNKGKIILATKTEDIDGIISGNASITGNSEQVWGGKFLKDNYGRYLTADEVIEKDGELYTKQGYLVEKVSKKIINPLYDSSKNYVYREYRKEWANVGLIGNVPSNDDGTCMVGKYAKLNKDGLFTLSEVKTKFKVISRISDVGAKGYGIVRILIS